MSTQRLADRDLPVLSAFRSGKLTAFHSGWELEEYQYRQELRSRRIALEEEVSRQYKGTSSLETRLATLNQSWNDTAPVRVLARPGFS